MDPNRLKEIYLFSELSDDEARRLARDRRQARPGAVYRRLRPRDARERREGHEEHRDSRAEAHGGFHS